MAQLMQKMAITYNQIEWKYFVQGKGDETILVFPGGLRAPVYGGAFIENLGKHFKIIFPVYPPIWDLEELIKGVNQILEHERIQRVHLFGTSFGGLMCQAFMVYTPLKTNKIILGNTGTVQSDPSFRKRMGRMLFLIRILPAFIVQKIMIKAFTRIVPKNSPNHEEIVSLIRNHIHTRQLDKQEIICHFKSLSFFQTKLKLTPEVGKAFQDRMLIIHSNNDPGVDPNALKYLKEVFPEAQYHQFINGGHMPMIVFPEEFFNLVNDFLQS